MQIQPCWLMLGVVSARMLMLWQVCSMLNKKKTGIAVKANTASQMKAKMYVTMINCGENKRAHKVREMWRGSSGLTVINVLSSNQLSTIIHASVWKSWKLSVSLRLGAQTKQNSAFSRWPDVISPLPLHPHPPSSCPYRQAEAAATLGASEFTKGLLHSARGVETLSKQQDAVEEEKWRQAIDHKLEIFDTGTVRGSQSDREMKKLQINHDSRQFNAASLTRRPWSHSPGRCGRSKWRRGLQSGPELHAHSHKITPCQHSTARWPPGTGRALPQCTGYSNHNNLRGHNISAHRRHTPHILPHSTSTPPRWGTLSPCRGSYGKGLALSANPWAYTKPHQQARKQQKKKLDSRGKQEFKQQIPNKASKQKQPPMSSRQSHALLPV